MIPSPNDGLAALVSAVPTGFDGARFPVERQRGGSHASGRSSCRSSRCSRSSAPPACRCRRPAWYTGIAARQHARRSNGWKYDYYRNTAYPVQRQRLPDVRDRHEDRIVADGAGARCGRSCTAAARATSTPNGNPIPNANQKVEESAASLTTHADEQRAAGRRSAPTPPASARSRSRTAATTSTAACQQPDPHNPNTTPDGKPRTDERPDLGEGRDPVRREPLPDDEEVPARRERRLGRHVLRRVGACSCRGSRRRASSPTRAW